MKPITQLKCILKQMLQYNIKNGYKHTLENIYKNSFFYISKNQQQFNNNSPLILVYNAIILLMPHLNLKTIRKRRNVFYNIQFITPNKQMFLLNSWLYASINKKTQKKKNTHILIANELKSISTKQSLGLDKRDEFNQNILKNLSYRFIKKKKNL